MTIKTTEMFVKNLKAMEKQGGIEHIAEMLEFAALRAAEAHDYNPLDALISVSMRTPYKALVGKALRAVGLMAVGKLARKEEASEYKGIKVTHRLRARKGKADEFKGALLMTTSDLVVDEYTAMQVEAEAEAKAKREELKERKATPEYWSERMTKVVKEAEKYGIKIDVRVVGLMQADEAKAKSA